MIIFTTGDCIFSKLQILKFSILQINDPVLILLICVCKFFPIYIEFQCIGTCRLGLIEPIFFTFFAFLPKPIFYVVIKVICIRSTCYFPCYLCCIRIPHGIFCSQTNSGRKFFHSRCSLWCINCDFLDLHAFGYGHIPLVQGICFIIYFAFKTNIICFSGCCPKVSAV